MKPVGLHDSTHINTACFLIHHRPIIRGLNFTCWTEIDPPLRIIVMTIQPNYNFQLVAVLGGILRGDLWQQWNLSRVNRGVRRRFHRQPGGTPKKGLQLIDNESLVLKDQGKP